MDRVRAPVLELLADYAIMQGLLAAAQCHAEPDARQLLRRVLDALQANIHSEQDMKKRSSYAHQRRILAFLAEVLNTHAHEHDRDTQSLSLAVASSLVMFIKSSGLRNTATKASIDALEVDLFQTLFSEYAPEDYSGGATSGDSLQIEALHDKIDRVMTILGASASKPAPTAFVSSGSKRQKLEKLRSDIEAYAGDRGRKMEGYQHLLQYRRLDDLIETNPQTTSDLQNWATTLKSYSQNKEWIDRQVEKWGDEVLAILRAS